MHPDIDPPAWVYDIAGRPMSEAGLDTLLVWVPGHERLYPLLGITVYPHMTLIESALACVGEAILYADMASAINNIPVRLH